MGALSDFVERRFGVKTRSVTNPITATVAGGITQVLRNNPDRLMYLLVNLDAAEEIYAAWDSEPTNARGVRLDAAGGFLGLAADIDGELVGQELWIYSLGGGAIYIIETEAE